MAASSAGGAGRAPAVCGGAAGGGGIIAAVSVGLRMIGINRNGAVEIGERLLKAPQIDQANAQVVKGARDIGVDPDRAPEQA